ncbi:hypothetical protein C8R47DRAFT_1303547 [Mycena vitilis]|nr:hypothetical protein C8R47DRAFT_1303547 [Mycena vitilis]
MTIVRIAIKRSERRVAHLRAPTAFLSLQRLTTPSSLFIMFSSSAYRSRGTIPPIYGPPASSTPYHGTEAGPTRSPCDQCHSDTIVQYERTKARPRVPDIIPIRGSAAQLNNGPCAVIFDSKLPGPGGVLVSDILAFRDVLPYPGAPALRHAPGYLDCVVLSVGASNYFEDIPGNCEHRLITCFNLAWWIAKTLQNRLNNNIQDLYLSVPSSFGSMDQKLNMPEILDMIFDYVDRDFTIRRLKTWAFLARTLVAGVASTQLSVLPALGVKYPGLTDVDLRGRSAFHCDKPVLGSIPPFLSKLDRLESLEICNIDAVILEHIARLPALTSLILAFRFWKTSICGGTIPDVGAAMIEAIARRGLISLNLVFDAEWPTSDITAHLYTVIAANGSYTTLDCLHVEDEWIYGHRDTVLRRGSIRQLCRPQWNPANPLPFSNLTTVILKPFYGFDVDDDVVSEMARAWCQLEELRLACSGDMHIPGFQPRMTLGAETPSPVDACIQTRLKRLEVRCSRIYAPTAVAAFLSGIFPQLTDVNSYCVQRESPARSVGRWEKAARLLGSTVPGRGEESTEDEWSDSHDEDE